jgi:hypothetical protein
LYRCRQCIAEVPLVGVTCNSGSDVCAWVPTRSVVMDRRVPPLEVMQRCWLSPLEVAYGGESPPWRRRRWVLMAPPQKAGEIRWTGPGAVSFPLLRRRSLVPEHVDGYKTIDRSMGQERRKGPWSTRHRLSSRWPDSVDGCDHSIDGDHGVRLAERIGSRRSKGLRI